MKHKINRSPFLFFLLGCLAAFFSCSKEQVPPLSNTANCDSSEISYRLDILPVIERRCSYSPCHSPGSGNYDYTQYEVIADRVRSGRFEERLLVSTDSPLFMPREGGPLDACNLYKIRLWIRQGFKNN